MTVEDERKMVAERVAGLVRQRQLQIEGQQTEGAVEETDRGEVCLHIAPSKCAPPPPPPVNFCVPSLYFSSNEINI